MTGGTEDEDFPKRASTPGFLVLTGRIPWRAGYGECVVEQDQLLAGLLELHR